MSFVRGRLQEPDANHQRAFAGKPPQRGRSWQHSLELFIGGFLKHDTREDAPSEHHPRGEQLLLLSCCKETLEVLWMYLNLKEAV